MVKVKEMLSLTSIAVVFTFGSIHTTSTVAEKYTELEKSGDTLATGYSVITSNRAELRINGLRPLNYPSLPEGSEVKITIMIQFPEASDFKCFENEKSLALYGFVVVKESDMDPRWMEDDDNVKWDNETGTLTIKSWSSTKYGTVYTMSQGNECSQKLDLHPVADLTKKKRISDITTSRQYAQLRVNGVKPPDYPSFQEGSEVKVQIWIKFHGSPGLVSFETDPDLVDYEFVIVKKSDMDPKWMEGDDNVEWNRNTGTLTIKSWSQAKYGGAYTMTSGNKFGKHLRLYPTANL